MPKKGRPRKASGIPVHCAHDEIVDLADLKPNPRNPNTHPASQIRLLAKVIREHGWRAPITVSTRSGLMVRGHGRLEAALLLGAKSAPVDYQGYASAEAELEDLVADNRLAELAEMDRGGLVTLLDDLEARGRDLEFAGFDAEAMVGLRGEEGSEGVGETPPARVDEAAELLKKWGVAAGDLWLVGRHRLMCGDATKPVDVARLLVGAKPQLTVADPPYGVNYDPAWREKAAEEGHLAYAERRTGKVTHDDNADWSGAWELCPGDVIYAWCPPGRDSIVHGLALEQAGFVIRYQIVWAKRHFPISRGAYHWRHEPCWYAVRKGGKAHWDGDRKQTTVWDDITLDQNVAGGHGTQKPVECMARPIRNHEGDVYDPFLGSGTTLVAAEVLGRVGYGMEIAPEYVAVSLERLSEMGLDAKREERAPAL